jgi:hypothetical protein
MSIVPRSNVDKLEFYEAHLPPWQTHAVAIGLTAAQVTALAEATTKAREAYNDHQAAIEAAKAATLNFYNAVTKMHDDGADLIRTIKNKAETSGDPNVYVLAQIPAPQPPGVTPPPGTPSKLRVELLATGALKLSWKCANPEGTSGTVYEVKRRIEGAQATFAYLGATGVREFTDDTLPAGSSSVTYQITALRSTVCGNPAQFVVNFGVGGDGRMAANVTNQTANPTAWNIEIPAPVVQGQVVKTNHHSYAGR